MLLSRIRCATLVGAGLLATAGTASAHHLMGGKIPSTFAEGIEMIEPMPGTLISRSHPVS